MWIQPRKVKGKRTIRFRPQLKKRNISLDTNCVWNTRWVCYDAIQFDFRGFGFQGNQRVAVTCGTTSGSGFFIHCVPGRVGPSTLHLHPEGTSKNSDICEGFWLRFYNGGQWDNKKIYLKAFINNHYIQVKNNTAQLYLKRESQYVMEFF